ncbi:MAG: ATP-binding cassette domain-containing protein [bacterium]
MDDHAVIELQGVNVAHGASVVLSDVNMTAGKGEFIYLIGKTGSGKSSLLQIIYADLPVSSGKAMVCGYNMVQLKKKEIPYLRRKLGIVFQGFQLFDDRDVQANLEFVLRATGWKEREKIRNRIIEVLDDVGLSQKIKQMPHRLSGGEQQRVAIARALLNHPEVVLADEPTGNLDPETSNGIIRLLREISESGKTVIMATHNYNIIHKFPARIIKCENEKVTDSGNKTD